MLNRFYTQDEILAMIQAEISPILEEMGRPDQRVKPEDRLSAELGMKSLDLARLVAALEVRTGADPFQELVPITSIRSIEDLQDAYWRFFLGTHDGQDPDGLAESKRRAESRRAESRRTESRRTGA